MQSHTHPFHKYTKKPRHPPVPPLGPPEAGLNLKVSGSEKQDFNRWPKMEQKHTSRVNGRFAPGASGNSGGRPKQDYAISELAKAYTEAALATLAEIAANPKAPSAARVSAAEALLNRAWGRASQSIETRIEGKLTDPASAHLAALKGLLEKNSRELYPDTLRVNTDRQDTPPQGVSFLSQP